VGPQSPCGSPSRPQVKKLPPVSRLWARTQFPLQFYVWLPRLHGVGRWNADPAVLLPPRCGRRDGFCGAVLAAQQVPRGYGEVAAIQLAGRRGRRLVVVDAVALSPSAPRMSSCMENDRRFSTRCWHAMRVWHRARRLGISEAKAESLGSNLISIWDPVQGLSSGALIDRLQLKSSGLRGDGSDDGITRTVARAIVGSPLFPTKTARRHEATQGETMMATAMARLRRARQPAYSAQRLIHTFVGRAAAAGVRLEARTLTDWGPGGLGASGRVRCSGAGRQRRAGVGKL
jgi:hypothetical protein